MTWNSYDTGSGISWYGEGTEGRAFNVIFGECFIGEYPRGEKPRGEIFKRWVAKMSRPDTFDLCWCETANEAKRFCEWTDRAYEKNPSRHEEMSALQTGTALK